MSDGTNQPASITTASTEGTTAATTQQQTQQAVTDIGAQPADTGFTANTAATETSSAQAVSYESTGHAGLDLALSFIGNLGYGPEDAAVKAAERGDFSLLKARLATNDKAKGWEQIVAVAERDFAAITEKAKEAATKLEATLSEAVGGTETWAAIKQWASVNADANEKVQINAALKAGGIAAKAMAVYMAQLHSRASGVTQPGQSAVLPTAASNSPASSALSPRAYVAEVQKLRATVRGNVEDSPEYRQLQARRQAWRG
jgi:hypothetical protein